jgi:hypothetical protein
VCWCAACRAPSASASGSGISRGSGDPRTDKRIDFVGGVRGRFALHPTRMEQLMAVADARQAGAAEVDVV